MKKAVTDDSNHTSKQLVFLNTPIYDENDDVLGFQAHVNTLQTAIDSGAQMIAITSPFGAGKSSVTELLRTRNSNQYVINVSMWSHLCKKDENNKENQTTELHRSFLYQIVSNLSAKNGAYISRRLSKNYGLLKLHTESPRYYFIAFLALVFFMFGYMLPYVFHVSVPSIWGPPELWNGLFVLISVICFVYVIVRAEVVFSSNKSEGMLSIDENELVELYRKFVLGYCEKQTNVHKFIFVIEDLDRTSDHDCVIAFLKELRKYYLLGNNNKQNKIVFVTNVKPETALCNTAKDYKSKENESLYAKLFDFVLNIQTINIDDYETVLESILQNSKETILSIFPNTTYAHFTEIPGMQWIIRGKNFGVRDIKDRLNRAFALYASLRNRFPSSLIEFEKCAIVSYLTTVYEQEFIKTDDRTFGKLVEAQLQHKLTDDLCASTLGMDNAEYTKEVFSLIQAKLIDSNYRMYFYNYPKNSKIYSHDEHLVQNAILYGDTSEDIDNMALRVTRNNVSVVYEALDRLKQLKLPLPDILFSCEPLYIETLRYYPDGIYEWMSRLDYAPNAFDKSRTRILNLLAFDEERSVYTATHANQFCIVWEAAIKEDNLLHLRSMLCQRFSKEILWYSQLFTGVHNIASFDELALVSLTDAIQIINSQKDTFSTEYIDYILRRFEKEISPTTDLTKDVQVFLTNSESNLGASVVVPFLLQFMQHLRTIFPEYEESVMNQLNSERIFSEQKNALFTAYQTLINSVAPEKIAGATLKNIQALSVFSGYTEAIASLLDRAEYVFEANTVRLHLGVPVDFHSERTIVAFRENFNWLLTHKDIFVKLRLSVIQTSDEKNIFEYAFLFSDECPILSTNEFLLAQHILADDAILKLIPALLVTANEVSMLTGFFNQRFRPNSTTYNYLLYIANMPQAVAKECFYVLNFNYAIKYSTFSAYRKKMVKKAFSNVLGLDTPSEKIRFMDATRYMDSAWEESIEDTIKSDINLQQSYISAVNHAVAKSITKSTIKCICAFPSFHALNDAVTEKLLSSKRYKHYILSKTLYHDKFTLDGPAHRENLWETYLEIFSDSDYPKTRGHMENNHEFLKLIMERKAYTELSNERRSVLAKIYQDADSLQEAVNRGEMFAIDYYQRIAGFADEAAAEKFISIIEGSPNLLQAQAIYDHCYDKLVNGILKAKYTRMRKKHSYM